MTKTTDTLRELRELLAKATPGPWILGRWWGQLANGHRVFGTETMDGPPDKGPDNAALIVALRNEAPDLLDTIDRLQSQVEELRGAATEYATEHDEDSWCMRVKHGQCSKRACLVDSDGKLPPLPLDFEAATCLRYRLSQALERSKRI